MASPSPIRVLIVDDHRIVAEGISLALRRSSDIDVVGLGSTAEEAIAAVEQLSPTVVLMDYQLAGESGVTAAAQIRARFPDVTVVMISGGMDDAAMLGALEAGASGYLSKTSSGDEIARDIRRAAAGEMIVSPDHLRRLVRPRTASSPAPVESLTAREHEILQLMASGMDNPAIAEHLTLSYHTVRGHVQAILRKLEARSKLEAVASARRLGLVDDEAAPGPER